MATMLNETLAAERLRDQIRAVRESILALVVRMDDIRLQQLPQIRADYALKIGCWEQALLEAELAARRAKRRLALAQAQANRGHAPQMEAIETRLDAELAKWMEKVEQARLVYEQAMAYLTSTSPMTRRDSVELKRLWRTLARRLHPDICTSGDEGSTELFLLAQAAYKNGDVAALRSLEVATRHLEKGDDLQDVDDVDILGQELELARIEEGVVRERLRELEECEEVRLGRLLADPEWVTTRTTELRRGVEEWEHVRDGYDNRLKELREGFDGR